jgi:broad specificity phosphatase PhoE
MNHQTTTNSSTKSKEPLHPEEVVTTVLLLRHGHTQATEQGKLYTDPTAELTEAGKLQAEALGRWLKKQSAELLLSSSSRRVLTTAEIVGECIGMPPVVVAGLDEWDVGEWEGRAYIDIKAEEPELYKAWINDPILNKPPGGESIADVSVRTKTKIDNIIASNSGKKIALVTHAGIIRSAIVGALEMKINNFWRVVIPVGSATRIDYSASFAALQYMSLKPGDQGY